MIEDINNKKENRIQIDKEIIPIPKRQHPGRAKGGKLKYPLLILEVNQSFTVECETKEEAKRQSHLVMECVKRLRKTGQLGERKFTSRRINNKFTWWRIK